MMQLEEGVLRTQTWNALDARRNLDEIILQNDKLCHDQDSAYEIGEDVYSDALLGKVDIL